MQKIGGTEQGAPGQNVSSDLAKRALCRRWGIAFNFGGGVVKVAGNWVEFSLEKVEGGCEVFLISDA